MTVQHHFPDPKATIKSIGGVGDRNWCCTLVGEEVWQVAPQAEIGLSGARVSIAAGLGFFLFEPAAMGCVPCVEPLSQLRSGAGGEVERDGAELSVFWQIRAPCQAASNGL